MEKRAAADLTSLEASHAAGVLIIADDLSSATDCGAQMAHSGLRVRVPLGPERRYIEPIDVLALDADSRHLPGTAAYQAVRRCLEDAPVGPCTVIYKSMDSTLRGNIGAEIDALLDSKRFDAALIAPAFPNQGRTTLGGIQYLRGVPLHETEFGSDPTAPVEISDISKRIGAQSDRRTAAHSLKGAGDNVGGALEKMQADIGRGIDVFVFDATEERDLAQLATWGSALALRVLWVGSTGLARYLPGALGLAGGACADRFQPPDGPVLVVAGSASRTTRRQLDVCATEFRLFQVELDTPAILSGGARARAETARAQAQLIEGAQHAPALALTLTSSSRERWVSQQEAGRDPERARAAGMLVATLAALTEGLLQSGTRLKGMVLTGGETAKAVARAVEARAIDIFDEIEPGVPIGHILGRHPMLLVTKAGGFGGEHTIANSIERIASHDQC